ESLQNGRVEIALRSGRICMDTIWRYYMTCAGQVSRRTLATLQVTYLRSQADNLWPPFHPQVRTDYAAYSRSEHLAFVIEQYRSVVVETNDATVWPSDLFPSAND